MRSVDLASFVPSTLAAFARILSSSPVRASWHHFHPIDSYGRGRYQELVSTYAQVLGACDLLTTRVEAALLQAYYLRRVTLAETEASTASGVAAAVDCELAGIVVVTTSAGMVVADF